MGCSSSHAVANSGVQGTVAKRSKDPLSPPKGWEQPQSSFTDQYSLGKVLGKGAFAQVVLATDKATGDTCAVKVLKVVVTQKIAGQPAKNCHANSQAQEAARMEACIWKKVGKHKHCVELFDAFRGPGLCFMTMELCSCSFLEKVMQTEFSEDVVLQSFHQMLLGVAHIHELQIVHRDIKPDNYIYGLDDTLKLCDFGLAGMIPAKGPPLHGVFGTPPYMSPEMVVGNAHDLSTDMWSLGATLYLVLYGDFPYTPKERSGQAMKQIIAKGVPEPKFATQAPGDKQPSVKTVTLARNLLLRSPADRLTVVQAVSATCEAKQDNTELRKDTKKPSFNQKQLEVAKEFLQDHIDPTVHHDIQGLLQKLQPSFKRSFSVPLDHEKDFSGQTSLDLDSVLSQVSRRSSKSSTHTGQMSVSIPLSVLCAHDHFADDDDASTDTSLDARPASHQAEGPSKFAQFMDKDEVLMRDFGEWQNKNSMQSIVDIDNQMVSEDEPWVALERQAA